MAVFIFPSTGFHLSATAQLFFLLSSIFWSKMMYSSVEPSIVSRGMLICSCFCASRRFHTVTPRSCFQKLRRELKKLVLRLARRVNSSVLDLAFITLNAKESVLPRNATSILSSHLQFKLSFQALFLASWSLTFWITNLQKWSILQFLQQILWY